jgi:hypothetical protein
MLGEEQSWSEVDGLSFTSFHSKQRFIMDYPKEGLKTMSKERMFFVTRTKLGTDFLLLRLGLSKDMHN